MYASLRTARTEMTRLLAECDLMPIRCSFISHVVTSFVEGRGDPVVYVFLLGMPFDPCNTRAVSDGISPAPNFSV